MTDTKNIISDNSDLIDEHTNWFKAFDKNYLSKWEKLLEDHPEAAICEAATRKLLAQHTIDIKPNEHISTGGPDFLCTKDGRHFYVEATCITKKTATQKTELTDTLSDALECEDYFSLTQQIFYEICNKTPQCSNLNAPCIIAIGTLHSQAGCLCFDKPEAEELLTGTTFITAKINTETGQLKEVPYEATDLRNSAFVRPTKASRGSIEYARSPISAILLCAFGSSSPRAVGVLHPNPNHSFDRKLLPGLEFGRLAQGYEIGHFEVEWI